MGAIEIPKILLPTEGVDMTSWAVNACDQFTSDNSYWRRVEAKTCGKPSTFNLIFPEIYLKDKPEERIKRINETMRDYLSGGVFKESERGFMLVERTTESGTRTGLVIAVDLEDYSFLKDTKALIRSTEATILERIPPRVAIRKDAPIELPHVMLLYDDETNSVVNSVRRGEVLYDFSLMEGGGTVKGTFVTNSEEVTQAFYALLDSARPKARYCSEKKLLFAVGDGNHSLATAKTCWDNLKNTLTEKERQAHPARFALVEAVNIYDPALNFEPIHRLIKTDNPRKFLSGLKTSGGAKAYNVVNGVKTEIPFNSDIPAGIRELDEYISKFISENGGEVDYVHGENELKNFTVDSDFVGITLPAIKKEDFFRLIISGGNLPKKTFSLGEGNEKRYYIEAKKIR